MNNNFYFDKKFLILSLAGKCCNVKDAVIALIQIIELDRVVLSLVEIFRSMCVI